MKIDYRYSKEFKDYHEEQRLERRLSLIRYATMAILILYLLDFWFLQIIKGKDFAEQARNNSLKTVILKPERGLIKDREGRLMASSRPSFNIVINRENNPDIDRSIEKVAAVLGLEEEEIKLRWKQMKDRPETEPLLIKEDADFKAMAYIEARMDKYPYTLVIEESKRYYVSAHAAHIFGYIGEVSDDEIDGKETTLGDITGKAGIEKKYDHRLRGVKGKKLVEVDSMGRKIRDVPFQKQLPIPGETLQLTIDMDLQEELVESFRGKTGAAVFLDPKNGEIYALVSSPYYDPNDFAGHLTYEKWKEYSSDPKHPLLNRVTQASYPPGSTFKILVAMAALEKGVIDEKKMFYCSGSTIIYGRRYDCWHKGGHGFVNLHKALVHSCNIYFYHLGQMLDIDDIYHYATAYGLGEISGIDLDYEIPGLIPHRSWKWEKYHEQWFPGESISVAIGQGPIQVTPIQMARFISLIANGGQKITPHINKDLKTQNQLVHVNDRTLRIIKKALWGVVNEKGTGWRARLEGVSVCGKTGTAQISATTSTKDSKKLPKEEREHAWFIGFAPEKDPQIAFAIIVEHGGYGGEMAAPIAKRILHLFFEKMDKKGKGIREKI